MTSRPDRVLALRSAPHGPDVPDTQDPDVPETQDPAQGALADALAAVGDRWTLLLIAALLDGPRRFGELQEEVPGIVPNWLIAPTASIPSCLPAP
jgi:HxlR-like helix-turn-helix